MDDRILAPNLAELFRQAAARFGDRPAFASRRNRGQWEPLSYAELYRQGVCLATALIDLGVEARDHVGHFGDNREEWILADCGVQLCGAADVPRGRDVTSDELAYIVRHAGIRVAFVENEAVQERLLALRDQLPELRHVVLLDPDGTPGPDVHRLRDLIERGAQMRESGDRRVEDRIEGVRPDDLFTLIYTSGTTGNPKGVMLTHANMMSQVATIPLPLSSEDRILSILPVWHIFERVFEVLAISCGACTYYSGLRTLAEDLRTVAPTFMGSAPRLWESLHQRILKSVETAPAARRLLFHLAYFFGQSHTESRFFLTGQRLLMAPEPAWRRAMLTAVHGVRWAVTAPGYTLFDSLVLAKIRQSIGGALKATISGGGALPSEIDRFFNYVGIPVLEGYGLTETSPVLAVRTRRSVVVGSVGPPIPGTEVRIECIDTRKILFPNPELPHEGRGQRGEICVRGPQVMKGYYRDPEITATAMRDGWFHTGDLGMITHNGCLRILGRCKETIVLSSGENLEPTPIEARLRQSPLIDQCMVVGQDQKFIGVLIVPDLEGFRERGIEFTDTADLAKHAEAAAMIRDEIRERISAENGFKHFERIREFRLLPQPFQVGEEMTNLFKLRRHVIEAKYRDLIEGMFKQ